MRQNRPLLLGIYVGHAHLLTGDHVMQIGFGQISPSASSTRDLGTRLRVKCLAHNTMSPARARIQTARSGVERTNHEATAPATKWLQLINCFKRRTSHELNFNTQFQLPSFLGAVKYNFSILVNTQMQCSHVIQTQAQKLWRDAN